MFILVVALLFWLVPIAAAVWALLTLNRIANAVEEIRAKLTQPSS